MMDPMKPVPSVAPPPAPVFVSAVPAPVPASMTAPPPVSTDHLPTITTVSRTADELAAPESLPGFLNSLPAPLRTQTGLMVIAGAVVILLLLVLYAILSAAHV